MRRILTLSSGLLLAGCAWAQHGGVAVGHSGGFTHPGGGFSAGHSFSMQAPETSHTFSTSGPYRPNTLTRSRSQYSGIIGPPPIGASCPPGRCGGYNPPYNYGGYRNHYYSYSRGVYLVPSWLGYGFYGGPYDYGYPDDSNTPQQSAAPAPAPETVAETENQSPYPPARQPYQPESGAQLAGPNEPQEQPAVTLVFKDGRPSQQIENYALTSTTLYVLDGARRREIPLNDLNLPLTEKTNREAGVDFVVPVVPD